MPTWAIGVLTPHQFLALRGRHAIDRCGVDPQRFNHVGIQDDRAITRDRAHRELLMSRHTELAHDKEVHWGVQGSRDRGSDQHTAARKRQHDDVRASCVLVQRGGKPTAGIRSVMEACHCQPDWREHGARVAS
jgi:hypothetical protein